MILLACIRAKGHHFEPAIVTVPCWSQQLFAHRKYDSAIVFENLSLFTKQTNKKQYKRNQTVIAQTKKHSKLTSNLATRLSHNTLGKEKSKYSWQYFTVSILLVVKSFMKNLLMTELSDCKSDLVTYKCNDTGICICNRWLKYRRLKYQKYPNRWMNKMTQSSWKVRFCLRHSVLHVMCVCGP